MTSQTTFMPQRPTRIPVDISVHITSVLDSGEAVLRDMTEYGALIEGLSLPEIAAFRANRALFPLGFDCYFTSGDMLAALPRSTIVEEA